MDEHTPIDVPIRLEEWDRLDCINEVDTIVVDVRPILDATDYGHMHPIFPNVSHRTVLTNMGAWNPQTVRENARRITDGNMLKKYMDDNRKVS